MNEVDEMPPGFRFHPTAEEIIIHYLLNKVIDTRFTSLAIGEVDLNSSEPWDLPKKAKMGENEWFFYFQKGRKYARGRRTNRATKLGYWKATGKDKEIYKKGKKSCLVGMKKTLVFYKGRAPKGERSNWVMHEYRLQGNFSDYNLSKTAKEEWVVCRVFHKKSKETSDHEVAKLTDEYCCSTFRSPTSTSFATLKEEESKLISNPADPNNFLITTTPYSDPINPNPSPISYHQIFHQYPHSNSDSRIFAPDNYTNTTGEYDQAERMCKMGTFSSFNNDSTGLSDDLAKPCDEGLSFISMPDNFDSLWQWS